MASAVEAAEQASSSEPKGWRDPFAAPNADAVDRRISNVIKSGESVALVALGYRDPNSSSFKAGEVWSNARDGSTGTDAKTKKKLWKRLKREVIHRDSPEELERKKREKEEEEHQKMLESEEYKKKVEDDMANAVARLQEQRAKGAGEASGRPPSPPRPTRGERGRGAVAAPAAAAAPRGVPVPGMAGGDRMPAMAGLAAGNARLAWAGCRSPAASASRRHARRRDGDGDEPDDDGADGRVRAAAAASPWR